MLDSKLLLKSANSTAIPLFAFSHGSPWLALSIALWYIPAGYCTAYFPYSFLHYPPVKISYYINGMLDAPKVQQFHNLLVF